jgi:hypothetical protein
VNAEQASKRLTRKPTWLSTTCTQPCCVEAQALEQAEADCARQGKHAVVNDAPTRAQRRNQMRSASEQSPYKNMLVCAICALALSATGCFRAMGPQSLRNDRPLYAASLSDSWKEQTLLNIVKIRYLDPPVFVDVGNIVASYSLQQGVTVAGNIVPNGSVPNATIGGFGTYTNLPTITYTPLTG